MKFPEMWVNPIVLGVMMVVNVGLASMASTWVYKRAVWGATFQMLHSPSLIFELALLISSTFITGMMLAQLVSLLSKKGHG
jgi:hypothetical protein